MNNGLGILKKTIGIWEKEKNEIVAIVNSEGEMSGAVFFQTKEIKSVICKNN